MRLCAHYQDTGAFFIAVLEKKTEIRPKPEEPIKLGPPKEDTSAPISSIVNELESKTNGADPSEHIKAADSIVSLTKDAQTNNSTPAMDEDSPERKRKLTDESESSNKRVAMTNDPEAPIGEERRVHYPPPPGAELGLTAHALEHDAGANRRDRRSGQNSEEPFKFLDPENDVLKEIWSFYGLEQRFPRDRFVVRNHTGIPAKKIYFTSALSKEILTENEGKGIKFVHAGVTMFVRQDAPAPNICRWRIQSDGIQQIEAFVRDERVVRLHSKKTLWKLLVEMFPKVAGQGWKDLGEVGEWARDAPMGCYILRIEKGEGEDAFR